MGPLSAPGTHRPIGNGGGGGDGWLEVVMPRDASMNPSTLKTWDEPVVRCNTYAPPLRWIHMAVGLLCGPYGVFECSCAFTEKKVKNFL